MNDRFDKILEKLENITADIAMIKTDLKHHMYRTDLNEQNIELVRLEVREVISEIRQELNPVQTHVSMMHGAFKLVSIIGIIVGIAVGVYKIFF